MWYQKYQNSFMLYFDKHSYFQSPFYMFSM